MVQGKNVRDLVISGICNVLIPLKIFDGCNALQLSMNAAIANRATSKQMKDTNIKKTFEGLNCET